MALAAVLASLLAIGRGVALEARGDVFGNGSSTFQIQFVTIGDPCGTMAQGGNVWEWTETAWDRVDDSATQIRVQPSRSCRERALAPSCSADIAPPGGDCQVGVADLIAVIVDWD